MWRESERISVFWLSGTKLVWTRSCGCAQTRVTAMVGTAHRREHRWIPEENGDWEWRADRSSNGEEMRKSRTTVTDAKEAWGTRAQKWHGKTDYQQEKSLTTTAGRIQNWKNIIHTSATQNRCFHKQNFHSHTLSILYTRRKLTQYEDWGVGCLTHQ